MPRKGGNHTEEAKGKNRLAHLGKVYSEEAKQKMSLSHLGIPHSDIHKEHITGSNNPNWRGGEVRLLCEECGKAFFVRAYRSGNARFCSISCHTINKYKQGIFLHRPNGVEAVLIELLKKNNLPFKYTGGGDVWLGNRNPDFINTNGKKQVIELLGTYWHPLFDGADRIEHYKQYGFDCLAVWEDELVDLSRLTKKIKRFANDR